MLTLRARWLLVAGVLMTVLGLILDARLEPKPVLLLLGLGIVLWITGEGLFFVYRVRCVVRNLKLTDRKSVV